jgi:hypothetical protein
MKDQQKFFMSKNSISHTEEKPNVLLSENQVDTSQSNMTRCGMAASAAP